MIDNEGFRLNVGIILANKQGQLFWGRRIGKQDAWQFPQGGMYVNETPTQTMYRELNEELGLVSKDVRILGSTQEWLSYRLPKHLLRHNSRPLCIGQKQKWFLLRLLADGTAIHFDSCGSPEFSTWRWVDYWHPLQQVISFKKNVYQQVLTEFKPLIKPYQPRLK